MLRTFGSGAYKKHLAALLAQRDTLAAKYAMNRRTGMVPLLLINGHEVKLSPGKY